jgi:hypothetical protein
VHNFPHQSIAIIILTLNLQAADAAVALPQWDRIAERSPPASAFPDRIIATKTVIGYFTNFVWGDYFYAQIETNNGRMTFLVDKDEDCFLVDRQHLKLKIRYDRMRRYIPQAGGYQSIDVISNIQTDRTDLVRWRKSISPAKLKQCRQRIQRATKSS